MIQVDTQGAVDVVQIDGSLNADKTDELSTALVQVNKAGAPMVVCDLSQVQLIDSDGLEWLLDAADEICVNGGTMKLASATPLVADILRLTGVEDRFEVFDTAKAGVRSFSR